MRTIGLLLVVIVPSLMVVVIVAVEVSFICVGLPADVSGSFLTGTHRHHVKWGSESSVSVDFYSGVLPP